MHASPHDLSVGLGRPAPLEAGQVPSSQRSFRISVRPTQIVRNSTDSPVSQTFIVTERGVENSLRSPQDGLVKIGRQQITESGERPNDIMLPANDRAISRSHCVIDSRTFFSRDLSEAWVSFLMIAHPRLGRHSAFHYLPTELLRYILGFVLEPLQPLLIDNGSMCGTYIKVSNSQPVQLFPDQTFLVGSDILIEIGEVINDAWLPSIPLEDSDMDLDESAPTISIRVSRYPSDNEETVAANHWQFAAEEKFRQFTIGRSQACDIHLPENTISRTQCRVIYDHGQWLLLDGLENKPTMNGTWLSICKRMRGARAQSEPFPLTSGSQIKISDTILQVDWQTS